MDQFLNTQFQDLKKVVAESSNWFHFKNDTKALKSSYSKLPESFNQYVIEEDFLWQINEAKENSKEQKTFSKRIFQWLDAFFVLKYVHFARDNFYPNSDILEMSQKLLKHAGIKENPEDLKGVLIKFPEIDRKGTLLDQLTQI